MCDPCLLRDLSAKLEHVTSECRRWEREQESLEAKIRQEEARIEADYNALGYDPEN